MKNSLIISATALLLAMTLPAHADDSAMQQLQDANTSGQAAVSSPSDEGAHAAASEVFDTPAPTPVNPNSPSEGSSGLSNAPTYDPNTGSGLDNAPTNNE